MQIDASRAFADGQYCFRLASRIDLDDEMPLEDETAQSLAPALGFYLSFMVKAASFSAAVALVEARLHEVTMGAEEPNGYLLTLEAEVVRQADLNPETLAQIEANPGREIILFASKRCYFSHDDDAPVA